MSRAPTDIEEPPAKGGDTLVRVSQCLARLIRAHISELSSETAVLFDSPAEIDAHAQTCLSLYLYQIENNPWLLNLPPRLTRRLATPSGVAALVTEAPPLVVDLVYMMVPYGRSAELELVLADKLARLFHNVQALSGEWLDPALVAAGNTAIGIVPTRDSARLMHDIWNTFPGKAYRLTRLYTLSPVRIPAERRSVAEMSVRSEMTVEQRADTVAEARAHD